MALCGVATLSAAGVVARRDSARRAHGSGIALLIFALSPIALGPISLNTYDAWPALLDGRGSRAAARRVGCGVSRCSGSRSPRRSIRWCSSRRPSSSSGGRAGAARAASARGLRRNRRGRRRALPGAGAARLGAELSRAGRRGRCRSRASAARSSPLPIGSAVQRRQSSTAPGTRSRTTSSARFRTRWPFVSSVAQALAVLLVAWLYLRRSRRTGRA